MNYIIYQTTAVQDLTAILDYYIEECGNAIFAEQIFTDIIDAIANLKELPLLGSLVAEPPYNLLQIRKLIIKKYIVFYKVDNNTIHVLRILNCRQEWQEYL